MNVVVKLYGAASSAARTAAYERILFQYAQARADEQNDPNLQAGLGEPKFELNNTIFTGPWGRPQNDGPAESATTLVEFANIYLAKGGSLNTVKEYIWDSEDFEKQASVLKDLLFVAANWTTQSVDLWEEESADHFFNRLISYRSLSIGAQFAANLNDTETSSTLYVAAQAIKGSLPGFWNDEKQLIVYEVGPVLLNKTSYKDIAVILGVLHGYNNEGNFGYVDDRVLATAHQIAIGFLPIYPIANVKTDLTGAVLGIPIGRYPEDVYNGTGTAPYGGNPWFLATASMAELFYHAAAEFRSSGTVIASATSLPFWQYFAPGAALTIGRPYTSDDPQFEQAISGIEGWADAFIRRIKYHTPLNQRLAEEYNRNDGTSVGALDLTWSYASLLSAAFARAALREDSGYITAVADLP
jgi:glucoamylase